MKTKLLYDDFSAAVGIIKNGGLVAVPTETVYGLAANGLDPEAVNKIYEVKGRPAVKPLALMVSGTEDMEKYCTDVPAAARYLAERFWPGPLTIVLRAADCVPEIVRAGGTTVGLRCPDHEKTLKLLRDAGLPFAAPSANPSGEESPKSAEKVMQYFSGNIDAVIDGGVCGIGRESTLIDMSEKPYRILREAALDRDTLADALTDRMEIIGITGGTGCGKTTALNILREFGAVIIDCDVLYHELLERDMELIHAIDARFPNTVFDGMLDRKALGATVFNDAQALIALNRITHKHILSEIQKRLREFAMSGVEIVAIDAIELIDSGLAEKCRFTVGVIADYEKRVERIMLRDSINREYAKMRVDAQRPNSYFEEKCSFVLSNNSTESEFEEKCRSFFSEVLKNE